MQSNIKYFHHGKRDFNIFKPHRDYYSKVFGNTFNEAEKYYDLGYLIGLVLYNRSDYEI